jgi:hypothetical protein
MSARKQDPKIPRSGNLAGFDAWQKKGKPFVPPDILPASGYTHPSRVIKQEKQISKLADKYSVEEEPEDEPNVSRTPFGNQAPPIQQEYYDQVLADNVESSALPFDLFNDFYVRGGVDARKEESEKLVLKGAELPRIDGRVRSEEEIAAYRAQFMLLKGQQLQLPPWDPMMFPADGTCVLFGSRRTGKSWMIRYLLWQYRYMYRAVIVMTNTKQNKFWGQYVPFRFVHTPYDPFVIAQVLAMQEAVLAQNELNADRPEAIINPYIALVLDDVVARNMHHDEQLNRLFYEGRHSCISIFIATQYPKALPPGVRGNADLAVVFPQESLQEQDIIREQYFNFFESKDDWAITLMQYTRDHNCIVLNLTDKTVPQIQRIYTHKAEDPGPFVLGCKEFWEGNEKHRREYYEALAGRLKPSSTSMAESTMAPPGFSWMDQTGDNEVDAMLEDVLF